MAKSILELKSELFGIFQTLAMLDQTYRKGQIPANFYQTKYLALASELDELIICFEEKQIDFRNVLREMPIEGDHEKILNMIKKLKVSQVDRINDQIYSNPLQLAQAISTITSKFITIMDYFQVMEQIDTEFLKGLIHEILILIEPIELLKPIFIDIVNIERDLITQNQNNTVENRIKQILEDRFYRTYQTFMILIQEEKHQ